MKWYYKQLGGHTHVRVFMHGAKCGDLCFRNEEFQQLRRDLVIIDDNTGIPTELLQYIDETSSAQQCGEH